MGILIHVVDINKTLRPIEGDDNLAISVSDQ